MVDFSRPIQAPQVENFKPSVGDTTQYEGKGNSGMFYMPSQKKKKEKSKEEKKQSSETQEGIDVVA